MKSKAILLMLAMCAFSYFWCGCISGTHDPLAEYEGDVLVALLGKDGCPGTARAMPVLDEYNRNKPEGVTVLRVDVPVPGQGVKRVENWTAGFPYEVDGDRVAAERLGFFFYPTLYIIDSEGEIRFHGGCEDVEIKGMVSAILSEKAGEEKHIFTPPMPAVGEMAAAFEATTFAGEAVKLDGLMGEKATLIVFSSVTCPFSKKAVQCLPGFMSEFDAKGAAVLIVEKDGADREAAAFYADKTPGVTVVADPDKEISLEKYGVQSAPFFYLLDRDGRILYRMPFTEDAARTALEAGLGLKKAPVRIESRGAG